MAGRSRPQPSRAERRFSWTLLGLLVGIAAGVVAVSFRQEPLLTGTQGTELTLTSKGQAKPPAPSLIDLSKISSGPFSASGPPETFDAQTLADKIDGKADLYLEAGFVSLHTQRISLSKNPDLWAEVFIFTMKSPESAFSVFSRQRRSTGVRIPSLTFGYRAANALCAAAGPYYMEIIAATEDSEMMTELTTALQTVMEPIPPAETVLHALERFPPEMKAFERGVLYIGNAFGYDGFQETYAVPVVEEGSAMSVFLAVGKAGRSGRSAAEDFLRFLQESGARRLSGADPDNDMVILDFFGFVEVVFSHGRYAAGVHEADRRETAELKAAALRKHLSAKEPQQEKIN